jgi:urease alpha subunit
MSNKAVRSVSFNIAKEEDVKMLEFIDTINFSGFVKEQLLADIEKRKQPLRIVHKSHNGGIKFVVGK